MARPVSSIVNALLASAPSTKNRTEPLVTPFAIGLTWATTCGLVPSPTAAIGSITRLVVVELEIHIAAPEAPIGVSSVNVRSAS